MEEIKEYVNLDTIRKNWILIIAIFGAIVWSAQLKARVEEHQQTLIHIGEEGAKIKTQQNADAVKLEEIKGDVKEIKAILKERK